MNIKSAGICRANGFIYEKLQIDTNSHEIDVRVVHKHQDIPCMLFPFAEEEGDYKNTCKTYITVCPIVIRATDASYTLGAFDTEGTLLETETRRLNFNAAKWESRKNYRLHKHLCQQIRCYEQTHISNNPLDISLDHVLGSADYMILRVSVRSSGDEKNDISLRVLTQELKPIDSILVLSSQSIPSRFSPFILDFIITFSIRIPWNQQFIALEALVESNTATYSTMLISQDQLNNKLLESEHTFMHASIDPYYSEWFSKHKATEQELALQTKLKLPVEPLFSIIVPLFRTPEDFFKEMINSVLSQSYRKWELILVNASPEEKGLCNLVTSYCKQDKRIRCITLEKNLGISLNTNAGISIAQGDFISFFDHDDVIEPDLFFEYAQAIAIHNDIDLLYCDEDKLDENGRYIYLLISNPS